jgi:hypothetical protein
MENIDYIQASTHSKFFFYDYISFRTSYHPFFIPSPYSPHLLLDPVNFI